MEHLGKFSLYTHIIAGMITLIAGPLAIFYNFKDPKKHRLVGKLFFYAMLLVVFSAFLGFLKRPGEAFFQLLFGISWLVLCGILRGVRSIQLMKGGQVTRFDWAYTLVLATNGIWMISLCLVHLREGTVIFIPILFALFGAGALTDVRTNWRVFSRPELMQQFDWIRLHTSTMLGAFTASSTAFTVNAAPFLPWWAQWFGPTLILLPIQFYFGKKLKKKSVIEPIQMSA